MIRDARESISIATHTFDQDIVGRAILTALRDKSLDMRRQGLPFRARILIDGLGYGHPGLSTERAIELEKVGIELRYYNSDWSLLHLPIFNNRSHRKLFLRDGKELVLGGRNIGDKYFELHPELVAVDRELRVIGEPARAAQASFDAFWEHELSRGPRPASSKEPWQKDPFLVPPSPEEARLVASALEQGRVELLVHSPVFLARKVTFLSDTPGNSDSSRVLSPFIDARMRQTENALSIENVFFLPVKERLELLRGLVKKGVEITALTNSIQAFPSEISRMGFFVAYDVARLSAKVRMLLLTGKPIPGRPTVTFPNGRISERWMLHTKTVVRDHRDSWVGSYNFDSRSANLNAESALWVEGCPELAEAIEGDIETRAQAALRLNQSSWGTEMNPVHGMNFMRMGLEIQKLSALFWDPIFYQL